MQFHRATTEHGDFERKCCSSAQMLCWRHDLTEVVIENCEEYYDQNRLHKYFVENVNIKVTMAFPENVNKRKIRYGYSDMQDRIFIWICWVYFLHAVSIKMRENSVVYLLIWHSQECSFERCCNISNAFDEFKLLWISRKCNLPAKWAVLSNSFGVFTVHDIPSELWNPV